MSVSVEGKGKGGWVGRTTDRIKARTVAALRSCLPPAKAAHHTSRGRRISVRQIMVWGGEGRKQ